MSQKIDFSDLSQPDIVALVANTALVAKDSGGPVEVRHARISGNRGILIFMPGFELIDGRVTRIVATEPEKETET